jgi:hypothetical protein
MDKLINLAEHGVYLKLVIMDKNDKIYYKMDDNGDFIVTARMVMAFMAWKNTKQDKMVAAGVLAFLQARWGYSQHSFLELTNEGDPF